MKPDRHRRTYALDPSPITPDPWALACWQISRLGLPDAQRDAAGELLCSLRLGWLDEGPIITERRVGERRCAALLWAPWRTRRAVEVVPHTMMGETKALIELRDWVGEVWSGTRTRGAVVVTVRGMLGWVYGREAG